MKKRSFILLLWISTLSAGLNLPERMTAKFTQTVTQNGTGQTLTYRGELVVDLPRIMLWLYNRPTPKTVCIQPRKAWVIEPELEQATLFRLDRTIPLKKIVEKAEKIEKNRYMTRFGGKEYLIETDDNRTVRTLSYIDDMDNRVRIEFTNIDTKPRFKTRPVCQIPDDFDIVDARFQ